MKTRLIAISIVLMLLLASCNGLGQQGIVLIGPEEDSASQVRFVVSLADLDQASPKEQWECFFQERGAEQFWNQLQSLENGLFSKLKRLLIAPAVLSFGLQELSMDQAGIGDEVAAGIIRYLVYYCARQVERLGIRSDRDESNNYLTHLPPEIGYLKSLQKLDLSWNLLKSLPPELGQLQSLQELDLKSNQLQALPQGIYRLAKQGRLYRFPIDSNPLFKEWDLAPLSRASLSSLFEEAQEACQSLPRSLLTLCAYYVEHHPGEIQQALKLPEEQAVEALLPQ